MTDLTPIKKLAGLGPASSKLLSDVGITSVEQLRDLGPVFAYVTVKRKHSSTTLNLLWAMAAGLHNRHWTSLSDAEKDSLRTELREMGFEHFA